MLNLIPTLFIFGVCYIIVVAVINYREESLLDTKIKNRAIVGIWLNKLDDIQQKRNQLLSIDVKDQTILFNHQLKTLMENYTIRSNTLG